MTDVAASAPDAVPTTNDGVPTRIAAALAVLAAAVGFPLGSVLAGEPLVAQVWAAPVVGGCVTTVASLLERAPVR